MLLQWAFALIFVFTCFHVTFTFSALPRSVAFYREVPLAHASLQQLIVGCVATSSLNLLLVLSLSLRCKVWKQRSAAVATAAKQCLDVV